MTDNVELSIRDARTGAVLVEMQSLALPVEIGRFGPENLGRIVAGDGRVVHFGSGFGTMSREHISLSSMPGGELVVRDLSSNGVYQIEAGGRPGTLLGRGGAARLAPGRMRQFDTVGLTLDIGVPKSASVAPGAQPLHLVYDSSSSGRLKALDFNGVSIGLIAHGSEVLMRRRQGTAAAAMAAVLGEGATCLVMIGPDGAGGITAMSGSTGEVAHNRRMMKMDEAVSLDHLDTVEIRGQLLRIMSAEEGKGLSCTNPACRQLNPYLPGENCRYCGQRLGEGKSYWIHS